MIINQINKINHYYVPPKLLAQEYDNSIKKGEPTQKLLLMIEKIAKKFALNKDFVWINKQDYDACVNYALCEAWRKWDKYDPEKSSNHFAFFTQMIKNDLSIQNKKIRKGDDRNIHIETLFSNTEK